VSADGIDITGVRFDIGLVRVVRNLPSATAEELAQTRSWLAELGEPFELDMALHQEEQTCTVTLDNRTGTYTPLNLRLQRLADAFGSEVPCDGGSMRTSSDSSSPDTSQPYPLDDLLDRIDDVTSERE
jgi:hypothetical protein